MENDDTTFTAAPYHETNLGDIPSGSQYLGKPTQRHLAFILSYSILDRHPF
jgi:hypothetical protein